MLDDPGGTGCNEVCFLVHGCWDSRDVGVVGVFACVKGCMRFAMYNSITYIIVFFPLQP